MLIVKLFLVAFSLLVQKKVFPDHDSPVSELDTLTLPEDNPETALAKRAMEAEGLCPAAIARADGGRAGDFGIREGADRAARDGVPRSNPTDPLSGLASACD